MRCDVRYYKTSATGEYEIVQRKWIAKDQSQSVEYRVRAVRGAPSGFHEYVIANHPAALKPEAWDSMSATDGMRWCEDMINGYLRDISLNC